VAASFGATASAHGASGGTGPGSSGPAGTAPGKGAAGASAAALAAVRFAAADPKQIVEEGGDGWGNPSTLTDHFDRHGGDFGSPDEDAYAREAQDFLERAVADRLSMKVAPDGTIRVYEPSTNTFGAYNADGLPRRTSSPIWPRTPTYWGDQPGTDPWSEPPLEVPPERPPELPFPDVPVL
jgi:hypothetical protein